MIENLILVTALATTTWCGPSHSDSSNGAKQISQSEIIAIRGDRISEAVEMLASRSFVRLIPGQVRHLAAKQSSGMGFVLVRAAWFSGKEPVSLAGKDFVTVYYSAQDRRATITTLTMSHSGIAIPSAIIVKLPTALDHVDTECASYE